MKKLKLTILLGAVALVACFTSCSENEPLNSSNLNEDYMSTELIGHFSKTTNTDYTNANNTDEGYIYCVDIEYPVTVILYNFETNETTTVVLENDEDAYNLFSHFTGYDYAEIAYPMNLIYGNGTQVQVNNDEELYLALNEAYLICGDNDNSDSCETDCGNEEAPVCVTIDSGNNEFTTFTFFNPCEAECAGYTNYTECNDVGGNDDDDDDGDDDDDDDDGDGSEDMCDNCGENNILEPVCVDVEINGSPNTLTFDNPCYAVCAGYNDYYVCE